MLPQAAIDRLREAFELEIYPEDRSIPRGLLLGKVKDADAIITMLTEAVDRELMDAAPRLRCVSNYAVGYNNIDVSYATQKGIAVCNTPGILTETTADLTWALILASGRRIAEGDRYIRAGKFKDWSPLLLLGTDIYGKTLGIIGMGRIGQAVAHRSQSFGMKVLYHDPEADPSVLDPAWELVSLDALCQKADVISVHVPYLPQTRHLIGAREFGLMKPSAILVNAARGPIVDEAALAEALANKRIFAAGLDVYEDEPRVHPQLLDLDNVVLVPHIGSASIETRTAMALLAAENAIAVIEGRQPPSRVN
jgi:lactate dehydrogenase-like 2-hydroxyacid dehydrogenase